MNYSLIQLRPRQYALRQPGLYVFIAYGAEHGPFVHETRMLSRYRWLIDGVPPSRWHSRL